MLAPEQEAATPVSRDFRSGLRDSDSNDYFMDTRPRILMCPPDYFGIEYEINPWMNVRSAATRNSRQQWQRSMKRWVNWAWRSI